jgi:hypothetical protein
MDSHFLYKTTSIPLIKTKAFQTLLDIIPHTPHSMAIICQTKQHAQNLESVLTKKLPQQLLPKIISLNDLYDLFFKRTYSKCKSHLLLYLKTYLHHHLHNEFRRIIYNSHTLMENIIQYFIISSKLQGKKIQVKTLFDNATTDQLDDLYYEFNSYLIHSYKINLGDFYKHLSNDPKRILIDHIYFLNTPLTTPLDKLNIKMILSHLKNVSWILDTCFNHECQWLEQTFNSIQSITEEPTQKKSLPIPVIETYNTLESEIGTTLIKIFNSPSFAKKETTIVLPKNNTYHHALKKLLIKYNIPSSLSHHQQLTTNIINTFSALLTFIKTPLTIKSIEDTTCQAWLNHWKEKNVIINLHPIKKISDSLGSHVALETIINHGDENKKALPHYDLDAINTQLTILKEISHYHKQLNHYTSLSQWFSQFLEFIHSFYHIKSLDSLPELTSIKTKLLDFIALELTQLQSIEKETCSLPLICDWLIQAISSLFKVSETETYHVSLSTIDSILYNHTANYYFIGFNYTMHHQLIYKKDYFETLSSISTTSHSHTISDIITMILTNTTSETNTISLSSSSFCNDTQTIPFMEFAYNTNEEKSNYSLLATPSKSPLTNIPSTTSESLPPIIFSSLSTTMLDTYQTCPYKFWIHYVLKLDPLAPEQNDISNKHWGIIIHAIMETFNHWISKNLNASRETARNALEIICQEKLSHYPTNTIWSLKKKKLFGHTSHPGLINTIIDLYFDNDFFLKPVETEVKKNITINSVNINSIVDGVFQSPAGKVIIDYKTGKNLATTSDIKQFKSLQLPLYLLSSKDDTIAALGYFQIYNNEKTLVSIPSCTEQFKKTYLNNRKRPLELTQAFKTHLENAVSETISLIQKNQFTHSNDACETSSQQPCRYCQTTLTSRNDQNKAQ